MNGPNETKEDHGPEQPDTGRNPAEAGLSGEGSASALAHMISRDEQQRHHTGEAADAAGSRHP